jgi:hypothetical protein
MKTSRACACIILLICVAFYVPACSSFGPVEEYEFSELPQIPDRINVKPSADVDLSGAAIRIINPPQVGETYLYGYLCVSIPESHETQRIHDAHINLYSTHRRPRYSRHFMM